jgi:hypothetical protein
VEVLNVIGSFDLIENAQRERQGGEAMESGGGVECGEEEVGDDLCT